MPEADKTSTEPTLLGQENPPVGDKPADKPAEQQTLLTEQDGTGGKPKGTETPQPASVKPPAGVDANDPGFLKFKKYVESHKLTQEQADQALALYVESAQDGLAKKRAEFAAERAAWAQATKTDPEIGGEKLATSLTQARRAVQKFGSAELTKILDASGLGNHPEVIRFLVRASKVLNEDTFVGTVTRQSPQKPSEDEALRRAYPSMYPKE